MKRIALLIATLITMSMNAATTIILVRHAEKAAVGGDMPLSEAGSARAKELARVLADARVSAIYATQYRRTQETVAPLAKALGVKPKIIEAGGKEYPQTVVREVLANHKGKTVLVAGHSNTTVDVLTELGMKDPPFIPEPQFDDLFVCTIEDAPPATCVALRYGAARPGAAVSQTFLKH
ncbi:MAG TPA: phosphoglycerate mutase family protein [Thermoanaerobaculia bacterium]|jgi:phosphohistidine phosphatase SixA